MYLLDKLIPAYIETQIRAAILESQAAEEEKTPKEEKDEAAEEEKEPRKGEVSETKESPKIWSNF